MSARTSPAVADVVRLADGDPYEVHLEFVRRGWSDGLPVIPPTRERVTRMLGEVDDPLESAGSLAPSGGVATLELIAVNAVMAGCTPEQFPVVVAAVRGIAAPQFNLTTIQSTTHSATPLVLVNGPSAGAVGLESGTGCLGAGFQANASIGRALRLTMFNVGAGRPGSGDLASQGHPGKFSYCAAENESASPWEPFHTTRGFDASDDVVTVVAAGAPINVNNHVGDTAVHLLDTFADAMVATGANVMIRVAHGQDGADQHGEWVIAMSPEHAATIHRDGFTRDDVQRYLFEHARMTYGRFRRSGMFGMHQLPRWILDASDDTTVPVCAAPERFLVVVLGGPGKHSSVIPSHGASTNAVSVRWHTTASPAITADDDTTDTTTATAAAASAADDDTTTATGAGPSERGTDHGH